jgi:hypothetical protein
MESLEDGGGKEGAGRSEAVERTVGKKMDCV